MGGPFPAVLHKHSFQFKKTHSAPRTAPKDFIRHKSEHTASLLSFSLSLSLQHVILSKKHKAQLHCNDIRTAKQA